MKSPNPPRYLLVISDEKNRNQLTWEPNTSIKTEYIILRKIFCEPLSHDDPNATKLGVANESNYSDIDPPIGVPLFYAVFAVRNGVTSLYCSSTDPKLRLEDVHDLDAIRVKPTKIRLSWQTPKNVWDIAILRSINSNPPTSPFGTKISIDPNMNLYVDTDIKRNDVVSYTLFCRYYDPEVSVWLSSRGKSIMVNARS